MSLHERIRERAHREQRRAHTGGGGGGRYQVRRCQNRRERMTDRLNYNNKRGEGSRIRRPRWCFPWTAGHVSVSLGT